MNVLSSQNWHAKEEMINFVIYCLLSHPDELYDYHQMMKCLKETINDARLRIKFVTVEAIAVIHSNIGSDIFPLIESLKSVNNDHYQLLIERFQQQTLPTIDYSSSSSSDQGLINHKLLSIQQQSKTPTASNRTTPTPIIITSTPDVIESMNTSRRSSAAIVSRGNIHSATILKPNKIPWDLPTPKTSISARVNSAPIKAQKQQVANRKNNVDAFDSISPISPTPTNHSNEDIYAEEEAEDEDDDSNDEAVQDEYLSSDEEYNRRAKQFMRTPVKTKHSNSVLPGIKSPISPNRFSFHHKDLSPNSKSSEGLKNWNFEVRSKKRVTISDDYTSSSRDSQVSSCSTDSTDHGSDKVALWLSSDKRTRVDDSRDSLSSISSGASSNSDIRSIELPSIHMNKKRGRSVSIASSSIESNNESGSSSAARPRSHIHMKKKKKNIKCKLYNTVIGYSSLLIVILVVTVASSTDSEHESEEEQEVEAEEEQNKVQQQQQQQQQPEDVSIDDLIPSSNPNKEFIVSNCDYNET
jgi:hypothetical protein